MGGNLFGWEEGLPTFPAGATVADADLGATSGAMDMYDEFGNYIGPELSDEDSEGAAGGDQSIIILNPLIVSLISTNTPGIPVNCSATWKG